jgi:hypothetical protein
MKRGKTIPNIIARTTITLSGDGLLPKGFPRISCWKARYSESSDINMTKAHNHI